MDTNVLTPMQLFGMPQHLVIPPFQRPYVWEQDEQWAPLWGDVRRLAEMRLRVEGAVVTHFLGAVVVQASDQRLGVIPSNNVIDGQQRLTTLQLMFDAAAVVLETAELGMLAGQLQALTHNPTAYAAPGDSGLKLRPTNRDQTAFDEVMNADPRAEHASLVHGSSRIVRGHAFFTDAISSWLRQEEDCEARAMALVGALTGGLELVAINLTVAENAQEIFETLNARGTPLTAADLVKNFVFQRLVVEGANARRAYDEHWPFETKFWETEVSVGRYRVSRSSLFLNQWLVSRSGEEISPQQTFNRFKIYVEHDADRTISELLPTLKRQADLYEAWVIAANDSDRQLTVVEMAVYRMKASELELLKPLLIWLHEPARDLPGAVIDGVVAVVESWIMRRMLLRLSTGDLGRIVAEIIRVHRDGPALELVERISGHLSRLNVSSTYWPADDEIRASLSDEAMYRRFKAARLRLFLEAVENKFRASTNQPQVPRRGYPIEHILPQKWQDNWGVDGREADAERAAHVHRLGNLTLLTSSLNSKVSNSAWDLKREALRKYDTLLLNSRLLSHLGEKKWAEDSIDARNSQLIDLLLQIWPVPAGHLGQTIDAQDKNWVEIKDLVDAGLLAPGVVLTPRSPDLKSKWALVCDDGTLEVEGNLFASPSGAGRHVSGSAINGWTFWILPDGRRLVDVRTAFHGEKPKDTNWATALPRIEWNEEDLTEYVKGTTPTTLRLIDYVATRRPGLLLTGTDFTEIDATPYQVAGVTGAMARKVYNDFRRSNPPIEFIKIEGRWNYQMSVETAAMWRVVRGSRSEAAD